VQWVLSLLAPFGLCDCPASLVCIPHQVHRGQKLHGSGQPSLRKDSNAEFENHEGVTGGEGCHKIFPLKGVLVCAEKDFDLPLYPRAFTLVV
jgi:hypothetical protein